MLEQMRAKAVIFDVDGVLIDAADWHFEAFNRALAPFGHPLTIDEHRSEYLGLTSAQKLLRLVQQGQIASEDTAAILEAKRSCTTEIIRQRCRPHSDRTRMLEVLIKRRLRLAAVSNAGRSTVTEMLDLAGLSQYLDVIVAGDDVAHPKPDAEPYARCVSLLGLLPDECLAVEDGRYGAESALAAGIRVWRVSGPWDVNLDTLWRQVLAEV
jgi:HAD superfamily hydrolase (TIGR01509 family)